MKFSGCVSFGHGGRHVSQYKRLVYSLILALVASISLGELRNTVYSEFTVPCMKGGATPIGSGATKRWVSLVYSAKSPLTHRNARPALCKPGDVVVALARAARRSSELALASTTAAYNGSSTSTGGQMVPDTCVLRTEDPPRGGARSTSVDEQVQHPHQAPATRTMPAHADALRQLGYSSQRTTRGANAASIAAGSAEDRSTWCAQVPRITAWHRKKQDDGVVSKQHKSWGVQGCTSQPTPTHIRATC